MTALYTLTSKYEALAKQLSEMDLDQQTVADTIEASGITDEIAEKAQGVLMIAQGAEMHNDAIDAEIARLQALKAHRSKIAEGLREYLKTNMEKAEIEKITCPLFTVSIRLNPPAVDIVDEEALPVDYKFTPPPKLFTAQPDKKKILAALKLKQEIPGAVLKQGSRLVIT